MIVANKKPLTELTLTELKGRAHALGVDPSSVEPIEATGDVPVKADWLREVERAEARQSDFKDEWRDAGKQLVELLESAPPSDKRAHAKKLAKALTDGALPNAGLVALRDLVRETAADLREADQRDLATQFSHANYHIRRAERATRSLEVLNTQAPN